MHEAKATRYIRSYVPTVMHQLAQSSRTAWQLSREGAGEECTWRVGRRCQDLPSRMLGLILRTGREHVPAGLG